MRQAAGTGGRRSSLWAVALALLVLGPGLGPGFLLVRDMVLGARPGAAAGLPRPRVGAAAGGAVGRRGRGARPGRPRDAAPEAGACWPHWPAGGVGVTRLLRPGRRAGRAGGPAGRGHGLRLERLRRRAAAHGCSGRCSSGTPCCRGSWSRPRRWRVEDRLPRALLVLVPLGCLSASAGLATAVAVLAGGRGPGPHRAGRCSWWSPATRPGWSPGCCTRRRRPRTRRPPRSSRCTARDRCRRRWPPSPWAGSGTPQVQPDSRTGALGLGGAGRAGRAGRGRARGPGGGVRRPGSRTALLVCWGVGWGLAVLTWLAPGLVGWASEHVPGAGVVRDGARAAGALRAAAGGPGRRGGAGAGRPGAGRAGGPGRARASARCCCRVALLPDLAFGVGHRLAARPTTRRRTPRRATLLAGPGTGDVLVLPLSSYRAPGVEPPAPGARPGRPLPDARLRGQRRAGGRRRAAGGGGPAGAGGRRGAGRAHARSSGPRPWAGSASAPWSPTRPLPAGRRPRSPASPSSTTPTCGSWRSTDVDVREVPTGWVVAMAVAWAAGSVAARCWPSWRPCGAGGGRRLGPRCHAG